MAKGSSHRHPSCLYLLPIDLTRQLLSAMPSSSKSRRGLSEPSTDDLPKNVLDPVNMPDVVWDEKGEILNKKELIDALRLGHARIPCQTAIKLDEERIMFHASE